MSFQRGNPIVITTGICSILTGIVNLVVGFMALFPGLFEASLSNPGADQQSLATLLATRYGLYSAALLSGSGLQILGGTILSRAVRTSRFATPLLALLVLVCFGLEVWGWVFKGYLTIFALPGFATGALALNLLVGRSR